MKIKTDFLMPIKMPGFLIQGINTYYDEIYKFLKTSIGKTSHVLHSFIGTLRDRRAKRMESQDSSGLSGRKNFDRPKFSLKRLSPKFKKLAGAITLVVIFIGFLALIRNISESSSSSEAKIKIKGANATFAVNKEIGFPLRDSSGEEISKISYIIEKAELRDEIIVDGKRATAIEGRTFLILTIRLINNYNQSIEINSKDYVRLSVNGNRDEWLAPDIHNDPVEVQAIATKYTRLGFPIDDNAKDWVLRIGEIRGEKEEVSLNF